MDQESLVQDQHVGIGAVPGGLASTISRWIRVHKSAGPPCPSSSAPSPSHDAIHRAILPGPSAEKRAQFARPLRPVHFTCSLHPPPCCGACAIPLLPASLSSLPGSVLVFLPHPSMAMAAAAEWWEAAKAAIAAYTGLSPAAFFTAVAVAVALYVTVSGLFARPAPPPGRLGPEVEERAFEPLPPPVQLGEVTEEELRVYDGSDPKKPLLMAIKGQIYDVTQSRMFYGPGGPYALFAGRDASRALAKMSFEPNDLTGDISGLGPFEVEALQEWEYKFMSKYVKVGTIKKTIPVVEGDAAGHAGISERGIDASTIESNHVPEPEEDEATCHAGAMERPRETAYVDVNTSSHEDAAEKPNELPLHDSGLKNTSSTDNAVEKPEETPNADLKNTSSTEDAGEPKGTPGVNERNTISPEDAVKPKEELDVDVKNTSSHEDAGEPKETRDVDEKNTSSHQDAVEKLKETADVEVKNA